MTELEEAIQEKERLYERVKEVREAVRETLDGSERAAQTYRLKILKEMYSEALERVARLTPQSRPQRAPRRVVHTDACGWDFFERSKTVCADLGGGLWTELGRLNEMADAHGARLLRDLLSRGVATLTERQRHYISRCFGDRLSISQVAEQEGVVRSTVSRVVRAGLRRLEASVISSLYAMACVEGDTFDHLRWAAATETLTERQRERLYYLLSEDASMGMIADHLSLHKSTVSRTNARIVDRIARTGPALVDKRPSRVVRRRDWRNKTEGEVAAALGISPGTYYRNICRRETVGGVPRFAYECLVRRTLGAKAAAKELGCRPETVKRYWAKYDGVDVSNLDTPQAYAPATVQRRESIDVRHLLASAAGGEGTLGASVSAEQYEDLLRVCGAKEVRTMLTIIEIEAREDGGHGLQSQSHREEC